MLQESIFGGRAAGGDSSFLPPVAKSFPYIYCYCLIRRQGDSRSAYTMYMWAQPHAGMSVCQNVARVEYNGVFAVAAAAKLSKRNNHWLSKGDSSFWAPAAASQASRDGRLRRRAHSANGRRPAAERDSRQSTPGLTQAPLRGFCGKRRAGLPVVVETP